MSHIAPPGLIVLYDIGIKSGANGRALEVGLIWQQALPNFSSVKRTDFVFCVNVLPDSARQNKTSCHVPPHFSFWRPVAF